MSTVIIGCGDVGRRIAGCLIAQAETSAKVSAYVRSSDSVIECAEIGVSALKLDLDLALPDLRLCCGADVYYTVPPQKSGVTDERSRALQAGFVNQNIRPQKLVLISTTGVYGDCGGAWVTEESPTQPATERGKRRLDSEASWLEWGLQNQVPIVILRVPGIYAFSRLPRERLRKGIPVVTAEECGFTNRIHADDLANVNVAAMRVGVAGQIYNVTDGMPSKITTYLQEAAKVLGMKPLPEISMQQAQRQLSAGMMSYLGESRKISNQKMLDELGVILKYPDFRQGIKN